MDNHELILPGTAPVQSAQKAQPWVLLTSYLIGYAYIRLVMFRGEPWAERFGFAAFFLLFFGWAALALKNKPFTPVMRKETAFWLSCAGVILCAVTAHPASDEIGLLAGLFVHCTAAYWVLCRAGVLAEGHTGPFFIWDAFEALLLTPLSGLLHRAGALLRFARAPGRRKVDGKAIGSSILLLCIVLPLAVIALDLLTQADTGFAALWDDLTVNLWTMPHWMVDGIIYIVLSLPVGAYLYALVQDSALREAPQLDAAAARQKLEHLRFAPRLTLTFVLGAFCAVYCLFFYVQAGYLFGAFVGRLPQGFTYAEYARQGFFQLCAIIALNFVLLLLAAKAGRGTLRSHKPLKAAALVLMAQGLLFAATALAKLLLYIGAYGFTTLRLLSFWGIAVLAAGSALAIATILKPRPAVRPLIFFSAATFTALCAAWAVL